MKVRTSEELFPQNSVAGNSAGRKPGKKIKKVCYLDLRGIEFITYSAVVKLINSIRDLLGSEYEVRFLAVPVKIKRFFGKTGLGDILKLD